MDQRPPWEANRSSASQDIARILWNPKVHYRNHNSPLPEPDRSRFLNIHFNIILTFTYTCMHACMYIHKDKLTWQCHYYIAEHASSLHLWLTFVEYFYVFSRPLNIQHFFFFFCYLSLITGTLCHCRYSYLVHVHWLRWVLNQTCFTCCCLKMATASLHVQEGSCYIPAHWFLITRLPHRVALP
jgi:hypothetical protein